MKKLRKLVSKFTPERILRKSSLLIMENFQGVDLSRIVYPEEVGLDPKYVGESSPTWTKYLVRLLKDLHINNQDTILDIGCGKGSAMWPCSIPFTRVDGIELSTEISETGSEFYKIKSNAGDIQRRRDHLSDYKRL